MLQNILYIVFMLLMVVGLVTAVRALLFALLLPDRNYRAFIVIPFEGHVEDVEHILRSEGHFKARQGKKNQNLVVADCGMDDETLSVCTLLLKDGIIDGIYSPDALSLLING